LVICIEICFTLLNMEGRIIRGMKTKRPADIFIKVQVY
jgi:hypothetical protein